MQFFFLINAVLLGIGLAMDAFSVSVVSGLNEPKMKFKRANAIAGTFAVFQFIMPVIGYAFVRFLVSVFPFLMRFTPVVSLIVLTYVGIKLIAAGVSGKEEAEPISNGNLLLMGLATSIDALSAGFSFAGYSWMKTLISACIILALTYAICIFGIYIGRKIGGKLSRNSSIFGGILLIIISLEIFIKSII